MTVFVTGVGLVCPAGVGLIPSLDRLSSAPPSAQPDPEKDPNRELPARYEVPQDFKPKSYIERRKDLKLMARANRLAVAASVLAAQEAQFEDLDHQDTGLFLAVGREPGNMDDILPAVRHSHRNQEIDLGRLIDEGMGWMNPLSSLKTLPNMSLAHVGIRLKLRGPAWTLCSEADAGLQILKEAVERIESGEIERAVVGGADCRTSFPDRVSAKREGQGDTVGEGAAFFILESAGSVNARGISPLARLEVSERAVEPAPCPFGHCGAVTHLFNAALSIGRRADYQLGRVCITAPEATKSAPAFIGQRRQADVAITGVGLATPLGHAFDDFSSNLLGGVSAVAPIQAFGAKSFPVKNACEVTGFDPIRDLPAALSDRIAGQSDRRVELGLVAALRALADDGSTQIDELIYGTGLSSVSCRELEEDCVPYLLSDGTFNYEGLARDAAVKERQAPRRHQVARLTTLLRDSGHIRHGACHFSACAAAAAAIGHGFDRIAQGRSESVLVGGCDSMVHPFGLIPFILLGATSSEVNPNLAGRPFDAHRDGFVMGEAGVFLKLERGDSARASGKKIYGYVQGWGSSCDAHNVTAPHPEGLGAELSMRRALKSAGLDPQEVDYINAHGTGTKLNDVIEAAAITRIFGSNGPPVSSSKGQFGHAIAAAGAIEALAALAAFSGDRLPPNAHLSTPDPELEIDLVERSGRVASARSVLSNSFGFGGQNVSLLFGHPGGEE